MPCPAISSSSAGLSSSSPFSFAAAVIPIPIGCVEFCSQLAQIFNSSSSVIRPALTIFWSTKFPFVIVPVLSITTAFTWFSASSATPPLKRIPFLEPAPIPEKNESGTLRTSAHGQLITKNDSAV